MEKYSKIMDVHTITKDGQIYVEYTTLGNNNQPIIHERPMYNEKGEIDPEVANLLELAKKMSEKSSETQTTTVPMREGELVIYDASVKGFFKRNKKAILSGIAGALTATVIILGVQSCSKKDETKNDDTIVENIEDNEDKIQYMTQEQFITGVTELKEHLKSTNNYDASLNDLYSFYYISNYENISTDLFNTLVKEGYIPDNGVTMMTNALNVTGSIADANMKNGTSKVDYNYIFANKKSRNKADCWQEKNNQMTNASKDEAQQILDELNNTLVSPDTGIPVGAKEIICLIDANNIVGKAAEKGLSYSEALWNEITNISALAGALDREFDCLVESEKQLTK